MDDFIVERVYAAKGDTDAADGLIRDYLPFIKTEVNKALKAAAEEDDALTLAMIAFHEAVESYSEERGAFLKYAALLIRRKLIDHHRGEKRHMEQLSLDEPLAGEGSETVLEHIEDETDRYLELASKDETKREICELSDQLKAFGVTLAEVAENCPKQERTFAACQAALEYAIRNPELIDELKKTHRLSMAKLSEGAGVERKTMERHRKYIIALLLVYSNGYETIREHLERVLNLI